MVLREEGRLDMTFDSYSLSDEEIKLIEKEMTKEDVAESISFSMNMAEDALKELKEDLDYFLKDEEEKRRRRRKKEGRKKQE
jgi:hypothetical protein